MTAKYRYTVYDLVELVRHKIITVFEARRILGLEKK